MAGIIGEAFVAVKPESSSFGSGLEGQLKSIFSSAPIIGAVAGLGVAVGGTLLAVGEKFQGAFNKIQVGTGATGSALKSLDNSFKNVLAGTAGSFDQVSKAITVLADRTHLSGSALDDYAKKEVSLARITKTDIGSNLQDTTQIFNQFGIAVGKQSGQLDVLFKASQKSGVGFSDFTGQMKTAIPTAQELGLNLDQTAAFVSNLSAAGLPATKIMTGLSAEFAKAAKAGKDPTTVIKDMVTTLKSAPNATVAAEEAITKFGISSRQAATLVDAVRSGAFNFGQTLQDITNGKGGINQTASDVSTLGGKFGRLKNEILVAIEPAAMAVVGFLNNALGRVVAALPGIIASIKNFIGAFVDGFHTLDDAASTGTKGFLGVLQNIGAAIGALVDGLEGKNVGSKVAGFVKVFAQIGQTIRPIFEWIDAHIKPILIGLGAAFLAVTAPVTATIAGLVLLYAKVQWFRDLVAAVGKFIRDDMVPAFQTIGKVITNDVVPAVAGVVQFFANDVVPAISSFVSFISDAISPLVDMFASRFGEIVSVVKGAVEAIAAPIYVVFKAVQAFWDVFHATILRIAMAFWDLIKTEVTDTIRVIADVIKFVLDLITGHWSKAWHDILDVLSAIWDLIKHTVEDGLSAVGNLIGSIGGIFLRALQSAWNWVVSEGGKILQWFVDLPGKIGAAFVDFGKILLSPFAWAFNQVAGLWNNTIGQLSFKVPSWVPFIGGDGFSMPKIPTIALAEGAIITRPTFALMGEAGPEAVVPLNGRHGFQGTTIYQTINPAKGMSEAMVGRVSAAEIAWQSRPLRTASR